MLNTLDQVFVILVLTQGKCVLLFYTRATKYIYKYEYDHFEYNL